MGRRFPPNKIQFSGGFRIIGLPSNWKVSREKRKVKNKRGWNLVFPKHVDPATETQIQELEPKVWKITLAWSQEALNQAAFPLHPILPGIPTIAVVTSHLQSLAPFPRVKQCNRQLCSMSYGREMSRRTCSGVMLNRHSTQTEWRWRDRDDIISATLDGEPPIFCAMNMGIIFWTGYGIERRKSLSDS